jgi:hypothetical protein
MNTKLMFIVVMILGLMILYNYYILLSVMDKVETSLTQDINTLNIEKSRTNKQLEFIKDAKKINNKMEELLDPLRKERDMMTLRNKDLEKRIDNLEEIIYKMKTKKK